MRVVVCDAGPLIHLDELDCLDLLNDFEEVLVPSAVWDEVLQHRPQSFSHPGLQFFRTTVDDQPSSELTGIARLFTLHAGELQALQIALERTVDLFITDDTAGRLAARHIQVPVHGTIGILLRSIRRRQKTSAEITELLRALPTKSTLHIKQTLLEEIIQTISKSY